MNQIRTPVRPMGVLLGGLALLSWNLVSMADSTLVFDLTVDWSDTDNPNGPWSYNKGEDPIAPHQDDWVPGAFDGAQPAWAASPSAWGHVPAAMRMVTSPVNEPTWDAHIGDVVLHTSDPNNGDDIPANMSWTSPVDYVGNVVIEGTLWGARSIGRSNNWALLVNDVVRAGGGFFPGDEFSRDSPDAFLVEAAISAGDVVKLQVERVDIGDFVGITMRITGTPGVDQSGWVYWNPGSGGNGHYYLPVRSPQGINWPDAQAAAEGLGGYLSTILLASENQFVFDLVDSPGFWFEDGNGNANGPWLGGLQPPGSSEPDGGWEWVTGEAWAYDNWAPGEPNEHLGAGEDRVAYYDPDAPTGNRWNDGNQAWLHLGYIVERDTPPGVTWQPAEGGNGHVYLVVPAPGGITWPEAQAAAEALGGHLTTIESAGENQFVFDLGDVEYLWYEDGLGQIEGPWLGGLQPPDSSEPGGSWQWVTDEPWLFSNWAVGEPNDFGVGEDRLAFFGPAGVPANTWNDAIQTDERLGYIVEFGTPGGPVYAEGLFNTGVDGNGQVLPVGSVELHYGLTGPTSPAIVIEPHPEWLPAPEGSAWIGPTHGNMDDPTGNWLYTLTIDLSAAGTRPVIVTGQVGSDDLCVIRSNGFDIGFTNVGNRFWTLTPFTISDGLVAGINQIEFDVTNEFCPCTNPTGLLVTGLSARIAGGPGQSTSPWSGWGVGIGGNGNYYRAFPSDGITWSAAATAAEAIGGYLATIHSAEEDALVYGLVNSPEFWAIDGNGNYEGPWLGGLQPPGSPEPDGGWSWVTAEPWTYTNWAPSEPNDSGGIEDRLVYFGVGVPMSPMWNDARSDLLARGYVVETSSLTTFVSDLDVGTTVDLVPNGGSGDPVVDAAARITNVAGPDDAEASATQTQADLHPGAGGLAVFPTILTVETSLADGQHFLRVSIPFDSVDLAVSSGSEPGSVDLAFFDAGSDSWELAVDGNTVASPGHETPAGDRFVIEGEAVPSLSEDVGDYGVFWNAALQRGFAWANLDHATDLAAGAVMVTPCPGDTDQNDFVDVSDLVAVITAWGTDDAGADVTNDGLVDVGDLVTVIVNWGACP